MNLLNKEINKTSYLRILITLIALMIIVIGIYYLFLITYSSYSLEEGTSIEEDSSINVHIDVFEHDNSKVVISGWAYKEDESIRTINSSYVLKNEETGKMYILKTRHVKNENVPEVYQVAGMSSRSLLYGLKNGRYDIYVLYKNNDNNVLANTGIYLDIAK